MIKLIHMKLSILTRKWELEKQLNLMKYQSNQNDWIISSKIDTNQIKLMEVYRHKRFRIQDFPYFKLLTYSLTPMTV